MSALRNTKQREAVLKNLSERYDHPTAEDIYLSVKKDAPSISLATVYRNLKLLEKEGKILRLSCPESDRFDGHTHNHYHFICESCGNIRDIEAEKSLNLNNISGGFKGKVTGYSLMFFGVCPDCEKN